MYEQAKRLRQISQRVFERSGLLSLLTLLLFAVEVRALIRVSKVLPVVDGQFGVGDGERSDTSRLAGGRLRTGGFEYTLRRIGRDRRDGENFDPAHGSWSWFGCWRLEYDARDRTGGHAMVVVHAFNVKELVGQRRFGLFDERFPTERRQTGCMLFGRRCCVPYE